MLGAFGRHPADDFGDVAGVEVGVGRVDALRRKAKEEVPARLQPGPLEYRQDRLFGCPRVGGRFQNDQHARMQIGRQQRRGIEDEAHVRVFGFAQRRRNADAHRIAFSEHRRIERSGQLPRPGQLAEQLGVHVRNIRAPRSNGLDLAFILVETHHGKPCPAQFGGQRQTDVTKPDHAGLGRPRLDLVGQSFQCGRRNNAGTRGWRIHRMSPARASAQAPFDIALRTAPERRPIKPVERFAFGLRCS